ncbi:hypothetical protein [Microbacterium sp. 179-I 3D4 NHS]|uniref:hypothetical protein n=1 Tax=Microbacterium sp. 179-I 3D4 NHS TaxID=3142381 RepID=UPI0039A12202
MAQQKKVAQPRKKVVRVEPARGGEAADPPLDWRPTAEAKAEATRHRWTAVGLWVLAIAGEAFAIFWLLRQSPFTTIHLVGRIAAILVIGVLASIGSVLWKKANRLDPARRSDTLRFFVQNQLGAIIAVIAFLPRIVLIFTSRYMTGGQKAVAGVVGIVVAALAVFAFGADYSPPSTEQYAAESNIVEELTGADEVFWTKSGSVFHVCAAVPDVNRESADGQIYQGTVATAHAEGKDRLTKRWESEAVDYCDYTQEEVDAVKAALPDEVAELEGETSAAPEETSGD